MEVDNRVTLALRMVPFYKTMQTDFTVAAAKPAPDMVAAIEEYIADAETMTGVNAMKVTMLPGEGKFSVDASPLLVRALVDCGPGFLAKATFE